ncbi:hypothetical protein DEU56DRAFT_985303 [Suillus clintonianus]|uniref:uncharacterized protein n=1 Tax=Suillus clintonianus TaxID=1904413 RepID=UPI001B85B886|nr:uncharacterized protein DEU56DRAFT_985303 [Suillus clintonianus]KAG2111753.1 hypothetical protein DEU56DRAFT_985303 [Suillus clintonianus]
MPPPRKATSKPPKTSVLSSPQGNQPLAHTSRGRTRRPTEKENYRVSETRSTVRRQATKEKKAEKQKKRALKASYQENPDDFEIEPSELHSDADHDEDTMFLDHALQTKLSNTKVLSFSMGKIPPASRITSGSARQLKAPIDSDNTNVDESSGDDSDKNDNYQSDAGAGQTDEEDGDTVEEDGNTIDEDGNTIEEQLPATRASKRPLDTEEGATVALKMKKHSDGSRLPSRVKVTDFDDVSKDILVTAISIFHCLIVTQAPFPNSIADETMLGKEAWREACQLKGINIKLTPLAIKMLLKRTSHVRGELKMKMRSLTRTFFGFRSSELRDVIRQNRDLAEALKDGSSFVFKDWKAKTGIYKTELLQDGINVMWFANRNDEGIVYNQFFNPMPIKLIALMLTTIECCIDEWMQGVKEDIRFTAITYGSVYNNHLNSLQRFDERTAPYKLFERICDNLHDVARFHAGVVDTPTTFSDASRISDEAIEDAIREHQLQEESGRRG